MRRLSSYLAQVVFIVISLFLFGCSGGGSSAPTTTVTGTVFAGPASGASVLVKNSAGTVVAGPATTAADGSFIIAIPTSALAEALIFEATGGSYTDEATAAATTLGTFSAQVPAGSLTSSSSVTVDPSSTIIHKLVAAGKTRTEAETAFSAAFGFTPDASVRPAFANQSSASTTAERLAGLRAAAFSQLTKDLLNNPGKQAELLTALANDLSDGTLDGMEGGTAVTTASGVALPIDIGNRFARAMMTFQTSTLNKSKLAMDKIGSIPLVKRALTDSYLVEYVPGTMAAATGKTTFTIRLTNRSTGTAASGKTVTLRPYMYMATKSHTTPMEVPVDNGDGTYACTVYYVMSTAMSGVSMGVWELKVTINGSESAYFYPDVAMSMGSTTLAKLSGISDAIMGMAGIEKRTWFLFSDGLAAAMGGTYTFKLFIATKEMANSMLTFPAVTVGDTLNDQGGTPWTVNAMAVDVSTDAATWVPATDLGTGHWSVAGLTGLTAGTSGKIYVRLTVNGEQKSTDGLAVAGSNGYQTFTVTPGGM